MLSSVSLVPSQGAKRGLEVVLQHDDAPVNSPSEMSVALGLRPAHLPVLRLKIPIVAHTPDGPTEGFLLIHPRGGKSSHQVAQMPFQLLDVLGQEDALAA